MVHIFVLDDKLSLSIKIVVIMMVNILFIAVVD